MWNAFRRDPLAWIIGGLVAIGIVGNVVMVANRRNGAQTKVLGRNLVSPAPKATSSGTLFIPPASTFSSIPAPELPPQPAPQSQEPAATTCLNSTNPSCGAFSWTPAPGANRSMRIDVAISDAEATAGEAVTFVVTVTDPDARIASLEGGYGDPKGPRIVVCDPPARYGPWRTPARESGRLQKSFTHTYSKPGNYVAKFRATSGGVCGSPYASVITIDVPVTVLAAPSESPSPSPSPT